MKTIYGAASEEAGLEAPEQMKKDWPDYRFYLRSWEDNWPDYYPLNLKLFWKVSISEVSEKKVDMRLPDSSGASS
ncbi:hypothetical protein COY07_01545 [Candidatus Peregrinibacteria bacterium CG_4_10_14_0_2_um_filter_43_11]|nr:MAG: hypothetical protein COY07_01545 [Candidatus Peregrinibacteria bacterium CG_4_10_14_0_2_um_filter_43_11]